MSKNLLFNLFGNLIITLIAILSIPLYIKLLGTESYGLIGFYTTLNTVFSVLDMGLSATMVREMAWFSDKPDKAQDMRDLARTLEVIFWTIAICIGLIIVLTSSYIAQTWIINTTLPFSSISHSIMLMGILLTFHFPMALYIGGLTGLQKLVILNVIIVCTEIFKFIAVILIFKLQTPSVDTFFYAQIIVVTISCISMGTIYWKKLPMSSFSPTFKKVQLKRIWKFTAGMGAISIVGVALTQMDKIVLLRLLSLKQYGYYVFAGTVSTLLYKLINPIFQTLYPKIVQMVSKGESEKLKNNYHNYCQLMLVLILPMSLTIGLYSKEIIFLWTKNMILATEAYQIVSVLLIGTTIHGIMFIPYALQLAHGITKLSFYINLVSIFVLLPLLFIFVKLYGSVGGAMVWTILNIGYIFITIPLMHKKILKEEMWHWYLYDFLRPATTIILSAVALKYLFKIDAVKQYYFSFLQLGCFILILYVVSCVAVPFIRCFIQNKFQELSKKY